MISDEMDYQYGKEISEKEGIFMISERSVTTTL